LDKAGVFTIFLKDDKITFEYYTKIAPTITTKVEFVNVIFNQNEWHHLALVVCGFDISLFIDGLLTRTSTLSGILYGKTGSLRVGQSALGKRKVIPCLFLLRTAYLTITLGISKTGI